MQRCILHVDADRASRRRRLTPLHEIGFDSVEAATRAEAVRILTDVRPEVVIVSTALADMDGFSFCRELKDTLHTTAIPVLIVSPQLCPGDYPQALEAGADAWLSEPVDASLLINTVQALVRRPHPQAAQGVEDAVREGAIDWIALADTLPAIVFRHRTDGSLEYCSARAYEYTGMPAGSLEGLQWLELLHPEDRERAREAWLAAIRAGAPSTVEYRLRRADGEFRWFQSRAVPVPHGPGGADRRWFGVCTDIHELKSLRERFEQLVTERSAQLGETSARLLRESTERQRAEQERHDAEEGFRSLFENATVGIYRTTPDGRIVFANPALVELLGYDSFEELARRNLEQEGFEPGYTRESFRRRIEAEGSIRGMEASWTRRDGTPIFVRESAKAVRGSDGAVLYEGIVEDVTDRKQAEDSLIESEERFRNIFDQARIGVILATLDGRFEAVNPRFCEITGYSRSELSKMTFREITHRDDLDTSVECMRQLLCGEIGSFSIEKRYVRKDQSAVWARTVVSLLSGADGTPRRFIAVVEDISAPRRQAAFDELMTRLLSEFVTCPAADIGCAVDRALGAVAAFFGADHVILCDLRPEAKARPVTREWCAPDVRPVSAAREYACFWDLERLLAGADLAVNSESAGLEAGFDLESFKEEGATSVLNVPIRGTAGVTTGRIALHRHGDRAPWPQADASRLRIVGNAVAGILDRKRGEESLRESEERFRNVVDTTPVLRWMSGPDKTATFFNRQAVEFAGLPLEKLVGEGYTELLHPEDRASYLDLTFSAADARAPFSTEVRFRRADGEYRWIVVSGVPRFLEGAYAGHLGIGIDITDLKRASEHHLAMQKLESLGVLAAGIAHDFNNLLGSIIARAESARGDIPPRSSAATDVDQIEKTAARAAEIVSQLMVFAGQETSPTTTIELSRLVSEMLDLLKVSISKAAILEIHLADDLPPIQANAAEIRQVVMNLITNASEALQGRTGRILVSTRRAQLGTGPGSGLPGGSYVLLEVSDTGCGMAETVKARIFDPFFTTKFAGRGLGLSAVQGIIRRHGGFIDVESAPGEGCRFSVLLPSATTDSASAGHEMAAPATAAPVRARTILFVEDEDTLRDAVSRMLRKRNLRVIEVADGAKAIEIFKVDAARIDVVILDLTLPGMPGLQVFEELCKIRPDVKVILTTAYTRQMAMSGLASKGRVWDFIRKPYRIEELLSLLQPGS